MSFRFLHTADWQIGMKAHHVGQRAEEVREARFKAAERVVEVARQNDVRAVVLSGDTFEDSNVPRDVVQRVVDLLRRSPAPVLVLPGNHDPLVPKGPFDHPAWKDAAATVQVLRDHQPVRLGDAEFWPCPIFSRRSSVDPLASIPTPARPSDHIRIGVAHGSVLHGPVPDEEIADDFPIEPEQVRRTGLDYLALGHWHKPSRYLVDGAERIAYAGSHEPTAFGEVSPDGLTRSGQCLVVSIESPRAIPVIEAHRTAWLTWESRQAHLASAEDLADLRTRVDSEPEESRSRTLLQLKLEGVLPISTSAALADLETLARARFLHARLERDEVKLRTDDLTWIEQLPTGPAVNVARALLEQAQGSGREAAVAREALFLLDELRDGTP